MADDFRSHREASRANYGVRNPVTGASLEQLNAGSLQRIADAAEKMAASYYDRLREDRDWWQRRANQHEATAERLARQVRALRGVITRMKKGGR